MDTKEKCGLLSDLEIASINTLESLEETQGVDTADSAAGAAAGAAAGGAVGWAASAIP